MAGSIPRVVDEGRNVSRAFVDHDVVSKRDPFSRLVRLLQKVIEVDQDASKNRFKQNIFWLP